jgi:hypothetical protein
MNSLSELIEHLESEPYYFLGSYWPGQGVATHPIAFEVDCEFTHDGKAVVVDGTYRAHAREQHPFQLRLPFDAQVFHAASADLTTPRLGEMKGKVIFAAGGGSFIGRTDSAALSAQVSFSENEVIVLTGALEIDRKFFGYSLKGVVASSRATLSNVVGIRAPRRT